MNSFNNMAGQLEIFFDGQCPLCRREINMLRRWDRDNLMIFTDISLPGFLAVDQTGRSLPELMKEIHARIVPDRESKEVSEAKWFTGVDVFREMYLRVGFKNSVWFSRLPFISQLLHFAYRIIAAVRFRFAAKRMRTNACEDNCGWSSTLTNDSNANGVAS